MSDTFWSTFAPSLLMEIPHYRPSAPYAFSLWGPIGPSVSVNIPLYRSRYNTTVSVTAPVAELYKERLARYRASARYLDEICKDWLLAKQELGALEANDQTMNVVEPEVTIAPEDIKEKYIQVLKKEKLMTRAFFSYIRLAVEFADEAEEWISTPDEVLLPKMHTLDDFTYDNVAFYKEDSDSDSGSNTSLESIADDAILDYIRPRVPLGQPSTMALPSWLKDCGPKVSIDRPVSDPLAL
ncbi:hypothetical protein DXG01_008591 [Tephrocybe rancida]|nr:hypothetical protein DXG01_008591 [Tephrocybe rancida]